MVASRRGRPPRPPSKPAPGRPTYASATRSAARGSRPGAVRVVAAAARASATLPPVQPTAAALWALLPSTTAVQPLCLFQGESRDKIRERGIAQITPGRHPAEWKQPSQEGALRCVALVGCTVHEAHLAAAAAVAADDAVQRVTALVHVQGGSKAAPTVAALLQTLRRTRASLAVPGTALQGVVCTERQPWETADPAVVDPAPPGHILQLVWERLLEDDDRETAELPDVDPAPLDPVPATVRVVCVLDPAVLADADMRRLHVGAFGKDHAWRHLRPLMGAALPHPPPMQAAIGGSMVEVSTDPPSSVAPLVMRASGKDRGVHFRPWIVTGAACQHPGYVLWFKQPPERRGPSPEVWKTLAEDGELRSMFAGLVHGGAPGNAAVRVWGAKPADPKVVAHIANLMGAPAPAQTTSVRVRGYPAQLGLAADEYAQLRRYAREAFGPEAPIRVHRCTQLAHSTLDRPVLDVELEGVPEDWQGVRLGAPDTRLPHRTWERTSRTSR